MITRRVRTARFNGSHTMAPTEIVVLTGSLSLVSRRSLLSAAEPLWMLPDLTLRLDGRSAPAHRSLEIATRFPQHPQHYNDRSFTFQDRHLPDRSCQEAPTCWILTARDSKWPGLKCSSVAAFNCSVTAGVRRFRFDKQLAPQ
jgi:hypothetical protein